MPRRADRVVRKTLADGSVKEYRYPAHKGRAVQRPAENTVGALIEAFQRSPKWRGYAPATRVMYNIYFRAIRGDADIPVAAIRRRQILDVRDTIAMTRGNSAAAGFTTSMQSLFKWAVGREWIEVSPVTKIDKLPQGELPPWSASHVAWALEGLPEHLRRAVFLAASTAQRRGDLIALRWTDYDGSALRFVQQKTGAKMVLRLAPAICTEIDTWQDGKALTILTNAAGAPWEANQLTRHLKTGLSKIAGIPSNFGIHGLRKFRAADLASRGATVHEIAAVTGHTTLSMVEHYTKAADQERLSERASRRLSPVVRLSPKPLK